MIHPDFAHLPAQPYGSRGWWMRLAAVTYHTLPTEDPYSWSAYRAFVREVADQFRALPVRVVYVDDYPYPTGSAALCADVDHGVMKVYRTPDKGPFHPVLSAAQNNEFRAVHDYYGHYVGRKSGRSCHSFGELGELETFRAHLRMFSALAAPALAAETVGQNAWFNYGPYSHLPRPQRPFAAQKGSVLPPAVWLPLVDEPGEVMRLATDSRLWQAQAERYAARPSELWGNVLYGPMTDTDPSAALAIGMPVAVRKTVPLLRDYDTDPSTTTVTVCTVGGGRECNPNP
jgi:hypothetical protein